MGYNNSLPIFLSNIPVFLNTPVLLCYMVVLPFSHTSSSFLTHQFFLSHTEVQRATHIALPIVGLFLAEVEFAVVGGGREGDRMGDAAGEILVVALTVHATPLGRAVTLVVTCKWGQ